MLGLDHFDLIILAIINEHTEGLTAYSLLKVLNDRFDDAAPSPGTLYPLLKKLELSGSLTKENVPKNPRYFISDAGRAVLAREYPKILEKSLSSLPIYLTTLINSLPDLIRWKFLAKSPQLGFMCQSCHVDGLDTPISRNKPPLPTQRSLEQLKELKNSLEQTKTRIQQWTAQTMAQIDREIDEITQKIDHFHEEKKKWVRIPVEDGD
jgi:DNA-binding PadR family transcriptional regulator